MEWTRNKRRWRGAGQRVNGMKRSKKFGCRNFRSQGDWNKVDMEWDIDGEEMKDQWIISRIPEVAVVVEFVEHLNTPPPSEPATNVVLSSWENERQVTRKYKLYVITPATSSVNGGVYCTCVWINVYFPTHYKIQILHSTLPIRVFQWLVTLWIDSRDVPDTVLPDTG